MLHLVQHLQTLRLQLVELFVDGAGAKRGPAGVQRAVQPIELCQRADERLPLVAAVPRGADGVERGVRRAPDRLSGDQRGRGRAELLHARKAPLIVDDLLQAAPLARVQADLAGIRAVARRRPGLAGGRRLFRFRAHGGFGLLSADFRPFTRRLSGLCSLRGLRRFLLDVKAVRKADRLGQARGLSRTRRADRFGRALDLLGRQDGKRQRPVLKSLQFKHLKFRRIDAPAGANQPEGFLLRNRFDRPDVLLQRPITIQQHARRIGRLGQQRAVGFLGAHGQQRKQLARRRLAHNVGIDNIGVALAAIAAIVLIGANFVVLAGMIAQIHDDIQSDPAHSGLEMAGLVFIGNDANTSILRIGFRAVEGRKAAALLNQKRFESKIGFLRIVLLKDTNAELTGQRHSRPPPLLL